MPTSADDPPARTAPSFDEVILPIERPFSIYQWVRDRFGELDPLRRILSQIRIHGARTMILETLRPGAAKDLREEDEDLRTRLSNRGGSVAYRLSFFKATIPSLDALKDVRSEEVLGYAIIKHDSHPSPPGRIYESVVLRNEHPNNYVRGGRAWTFNVAGRPFSVTGYLYAQQNGITNCCAHVALRTVAARFHADHDMTYREMNTLLGIDHVRTRLGPDGNCSGITAKQMAEVLEAAGARCVVADYQKKRRKTPLPPYQKYVYSSVESGFPAIIVFKTHGSLGEVAHAVPVFGHTFNQDIWVPEAERFYFRNGPRSGYTPSDSWLSSFLCHDDNVGSNLCIPRHYLRIPTATVASKSPNLGADHVATVIATLPADVKLSAIQAEAIAFDYLGPILATLPSRQNPWSECLRKTWEGGRVILRTILCDATEYANHLAGVSDWDRRKAHAEDVAVMRELGPEAYRLVEISVPELFPANRRKVGDVLINANSFSATARDFKNFVMGRLPEYYVFYNRSIANDEVQFDYVPCAIRSHVELFGSEDDADAAG